MNNELFPLLVTQIWQVTLVTLAVWGAVRLFAKNRPHLAHVLWVLVLIKCITPPVFSSHLSPFSWVATPAQHSLANKTQTFNYSVGSILDSSKRRTSLEPVVFQFFSDSNDTGTEHAFLAANLEQDSEPKSMSISFIVVLVWLSGAAIGLAWTALRVSMFLGWIKRSRRCESIEMQRLIARLSDKLGIKRHVSARILDIPVGPAVIGFLRPEILLPASIFEGKTASELESLIAHELIHVRRGDLWWALLQTIAQSLFWFHPLVLIATRMVTRESERSCDEETVASLGCNPADYARGLLEILEHKHRLRVAPALPGVRPVDITSARLERVMKLGQGSHKRTPWWTWIVLLICGAIVLPGATLLYGQDTQTEHGQSHFELPPVDSPLVEAPTNLEKSPIVVGERVAQKAVQAAYRLKLYDVSGLLAKIDDLLESPLPGSAEARLIEMFCPIPEMPTTDNGNCIEFIAGDNGELGRVTLGNLEPNYKILGDTLYVYESDKAVAELESYLDHYREFGFYQLTIQAVLVENAGDVLDKAGFDWKKLGDEHTAQVGTTNEVEPLGPEFRLSAAAAKLKASRQANPDKKIQLAPNDQRVANASYSIIDNATLDILKQKMNVDDNCKVLSSPRLTTLNGQQARATIGRQHPFFAGYDVVRVDATGKTIHQPKIDELEVGISVFAKPLILDNGMIRLETKIERTEVQEIQAFALDEDDKGNTGKNQVQLPVLDIEKICANIQLEAGKTVVLRSYGSIDESKLESMAVIMTCHVLETIGEPLAETNSDTVATSAPPKPASRFRIQAEGGARVLLTPSDGNGQPAPETMPTLFTTREGTHELIIQSSQTGKNWDVSKGQYVSAGEVRFRIETEVDIKTTEDGTVISGRDLVLLTEDRQTFMSGDHGTMSSNGLDSLTLRFKGDATLSHGKVSQTSADTIEKTHSGDKVEITLSGNAHAVSGTSHFSADRISIEPGESIMILEGNAKMTRKKEDGSTENVSGQKIRWVNDGHIELMKK